MLKNEEGAGPEEDLDGAQDQSNTEGNADESKQGAAADSDDGAEGDASGKERGEDAGGGGEAEAKDGGEEQPGWVKTVLEKMERLEKKEEPAGEDEGKELESILIPNIDDKTIAKLEETYEVSKGQVALMQRMVNMGLQRIYSHFGGKFGNMAKVSAIEAMGKDPRFSDIQKYRPAMEKIVSKFSGKEQSSPEVLEMAYYAAKGMGASGAVRKASQSTEQNRRIAGSVQKGSGGGGKSKGEKPLTSDQESARKAAGMGEKEYRKYLAKSPRRQG